MNSLVFQCLVDQIHEIVIKFFVLEHNIILPTRLITVCDRILVLTRSIVGVSTGQEALRVCTFSKPTAGISKKKTPLKDLRRYPEILREA